MRDPARKGRRRTPAVQTTIQPASFTPPSSRFNELSPKFSAPERLRPSPTLSVRGTRAGGGPKERFHAHSNAPPFRPNPPARSRGGKSWVAPRSRSWSQCSPAAFRRAAGHHYMCDRPTRKYSRSYRRAIRVRRRSGHWSTSSREQALSCTSSAASAPSVTSRRVCLTQSRSLGTLGSSEFSSRREGKARRNWLSLVTNSSTRSR